MALKSTSLLETARDSGLIDKREVAAILADARRSRQDPVELATTRLRLPPEALYRALADERGLPFLDASELTPSPALLAGIPVRLLERRQLLPIRRDGARVVVAACDPDPAAVEPLRRLLNAPIALAISEPSALNAAIQRLNTTATTEVGFDAVAALDGILREAYLRRASDVHLDPRPTGHVVRLRVDGRLRNVGGVIAPEDAAQLVARVKVLGGLDIAERRQPQDGGFHYALDGISDAPTIDVRLATIPARYGERATLRLLGLETRRLTIENLGFHPSTLARFQEVLSQPHGLVLLTGPTGSGKSTTLYAALRAIEDPELNLMTVEDPIEFDLDGVTQIQVDRAGKVTFAGALRSLLRHDPDVLMVGEIRDRETADVALKAAMTGHLVLSSLHTNRAWSAVHRLVDIGCEPFLVAETLRAALAQRLVRRLCQRCRGTRDAAPGELSSFGVPDDQTPELKTPVGCPSCVGTGYVGRLAVTEALWLDPEFEAAIAGGAAEHELAALARTKGTRDLAADALDKLLAGETSLEEALRARF